MPVYAIRFEGRPQGGRATREALSFLGDDGRFGFVALRVVRAANEQEAISAAADEITEELAREIGAQPAEHFDLVASNPTELPPGADWRTRGLLWHSETASRRRSGRLRAPIRRRAGSEKQGEQYNDEQNEDGQPKQQHHRWPAHASESDAAPESAR